jgi:hypothetical protein
MTLFYLNYFQRTHLGFVLTRLSPSPISHSETAAIPGRRFILANRKSACQSKQQETPSPEGPEESKSP